MDTKLSHVVAESTLGLFEIKTAKIVKCLYKAHSGADNGSMQDVYFAYVQSV